MKKDNMETSDYEDEYIGWWIKDVPYTYSSKDVSRTYGTTVNVKMKKGSSCEFVNKLFLSGQPKHGKKMEGRTFYKPQKKLLYPLKDVVLKPSYSPSEKLIVDLAPLKDVKFDLASLICSKLSSGLSDQEIIQTLVRCNVVHDRSCENKICSEYGYKIARSLIRIAATRIFANPEQSIIELPVNSMDSYFPESKVGKFGMGFFSILYWLVNHPKRKLVIDSWYVGGAYTVTIQELNERLTFTLNTKPGSLVTKYGTRIRLLAHSDHFSLSEHNEFFNQLSKLKYITLSPIYKVSKFNNVYYPFNTTKTTANPVYVMMSQEEIVVEDFAKGIPLKILFGSLFVPSISTKGIGSGGVQKQKVDIEISPVGYFGTFVILVGGVGVFQISNNNPEKSYAFILKFPSNTRLPVSRDDVIVEYDELVFVFGELLEESAKISRKDKSTATSTLQGLLDMYSKYTSRNETKDAITQSLAIFNENNKRYLVDASSYEFMKTLNPKFIPSKTYDVYEIEQELFRMNVVELGLWYGVGVVEVDVDDFLVSNGGLLNILFVGRKYRGSLGNDFVNTITSSYTKRVLLKNPSTSSLSGDKKALESLKFGTRALFGTIYKVEDAAQCDKFVGLMTKMNKLFVKHFGKSVLQDLALWSSQTLSSNKVASNTYSGQLSSFLVRKQKWTPQAFGYKEDIVRQYLKFSVDSFVKVDGSVLATFVEKGGVFWNNDLIAYVDNKAKTYEEILVIQLFYWNTVPTWRLKTQEEQKVYIDMCFKRVRTLPGSRYEYMKIFPYGYPSDFEMLHRERNFGEEYISMMHIKPSQPITIHEMPNQCTFFLSQLINASFDRQANILNFESLCEAIKNYESKVDLQIIEIAVNEGTTKNPIEATLTELTQNSIDAYGDSTSKEIHINYSVENDHISLVVVDLVGMTFENFIHLSIPFLSTKSGIETIGEMGSGFFNVYSMSDEVIIQTVRDGWVVTSKETPIRKRERVVDIQKRVSVAKALANNHTKIVCKIPTNGSAEQASDYIATIQSYTKNVLGLTVSNGLDLYLNGERVVVEKDFESEMGVVFVYRLKKKFPSYLLTKGIPVSPITDTFHKQIPHGADTIISSGFLVNLMRGYAPVQSRTRVNLPNDILRDITVAINRICFLKSIEEIELGRLNHVPNMESTASVSQMIFSSFPTTEEYLADYYLAFLNYPFEGNVGVVHILNYVITMAGSLEEAYELINMKFDSYKTQEPSVKNRIITICKRFFSNKSFKIVEASSKTKTQKTNKFEKDVRNVFTTIVNVWWSLAIKLGIKGYSDHHPKVVIENSEIPEYVGLYNCKTHTLYFDIGLHKEEDIRVFLELLKSGDVLKLSEFFRENKFGNDFFGEKIVSSTFPHELEHARSRESHKLSSHGTTNEIIIPGESSKTRTFNERTNEVYSYMRMKGFWNEVVKELSK